MSVAARSGPPTRYDRPDRYQWRGQDYWDGRPNHYGRAIPHAGPALIGLAILGFIFCWPVGFAALALTFWSVKMTCGHHGGEGRWGERWQERMMARGGSSGSRNIMTGTASARAAATVPSTIIALRRCDGWKMRKRNLASS